MPKIMIGLLNAKGAETGRTSAAEPNEANTPEPRPKGPTETVSLGAKGLDFKHALIQQQYKTKLDNASETPEVFGTVLPPDASEPLSAKATEDQSLERLALGKSVNKALVRAGFETIGDLRAYDGDWTAHSGIGDVSAEKIIATLDAYADAPETNEEPEADEDAPFVCVECGSEDLVHPVTGGTTRVYDAPDEDPGLSVEFDGLIIVSSDLTIQGVQDWKVVDADQVFSGADSDNIVLAALKTFTEYRKVVLVIPDGSPYYHKVQDFAGKYGVPCFTSIPF